MGNCSYPECQTEGLVVVKYAPVEIRSCDEHWPVLYKQHLTGKRSPSTSIGQIIDKWSHIDKKTGNSINHKLSGGKAAEIRDRIVCKEDKNVILNRTTGKPAQY